ncbi:VIT family protein [uncultured Jatrophihabitans sp.]|uniref:VIT1/CCC1 transporter family protein n=1 Tax=uncultured Jatrophihabitans sp. TaxID=1610747 RepID=UPI0035CA8123
MTYESGPTQEQVRAAASGEPTHLAEPHDSERTGRLNWLRAGVLGANDGIVSTAGIVVGVAGASSATGAIFTAGLAGLVAGAVSMSLGEYVSVSSQRDSERALLAKEKSELSTDPDEELAELAALYQAKGLSETTAYQVAVELTEHDALAAHLDVELGIDPDNLANPVQAAAASGVAFTIGAVLPLLAILLPPPAWRVRVCVVAVLAALALAGTISARLGSAPVGRAVLRVLVGGALGLAFTYAVGSLFGTAVG